MQYNIYEQDAAITMVQSEMRWREEEMKRERERERWSVKFSEIWDRRTAVSLISTPEDRLGVRQHRYAVTV